MGSTKDLTGSFQVSLNGGEVMADPVEVADGSNLNSHYLKGGVSCEKKSDSSPFNVNSEVKHLDGSGPCQPQEMVNSLGETSEVKDKTSEQTDQTSAVHVEESSDIVQRDTVVTAKVTKVAQENSRLSAGPVKDQTKNECSSPHPSQTSSKAVDDSNVTNHASTCSIKKEVIEEIKSSSHSSDKETDSLNECGNPKGDYAVLSDGSTVITNSKAIRNEEQSLKKAIDPNISLPEKDSNNLAHSDGQKQNTEASTKFQINVHETQEPKQIKVQSPQTKASQGVTVKLVIHKDNTMQPEPKSAGNFCSITKGNEDKRTGELNVLPNSGVKESGSTLKPSSALNPSQHEEKNQLKQSGGSKIKARCLSESDAKLKVHDNVFRDNKGQAVTSPTYISPHTLSASTQHAEIQVSLEALCKSAATSPMTPPEGCAAFFFPYSTGKGAPPGVEEVKIATKDAELQVGHQVESRSVATAPMSPLSLTAEASYPEIQIKGVTEDDQPEPVREVRWDEKGMTWEVYGAAMEVEVLGMAIQKHLEKQIEEHGKPPPLLPLAATPNTAVNRTGSLKGPVKALQEKRQHRNPFRVVLQNIRRPRCCARASTIE
ncbi:GRIN1 protein, partial [Atractosteus spatula]|nr:GRIN1 protein [Atractosteus spatula]